MKKVNSSKTNLSLEYYGGICEKKSEPYVQTSREKRENNFLNLGSYHISAFLKTVGELFFYEWQYNVLVRENIVHVTCWNIAKGGPKRNLYVRIST